MNNKQATLKHTFLISQIIILGLCNVLLSGCAAPDRTSNAIKFEQVSNLLEQEGFKGIVAIRIGDESYLSGIGDGVTSLGHADANTLVDIGSITKPITAAAILRLSEMGELSTSDTLEKFIPNVSNISSDKTEITIHQLLTHSSGLPDAVGDDHEIGLTKDVFLERTLSADLTFQPGTDYAYSNVGYSLLAVIIEQVSGLTYEDFIRNVLLKNMQLPSFGYHAAYDPKHSMLMETGDDIAKGSWDGQPNWALIGNGGLVATAPDIIEFQAKLNVGEILSSNSVKLAQTPHQQEGEGAPSYYGYGIVVEDTSQFGQLYWHNGGNGQFHANLTTFSDYDLIIFTASNTPAYDADNATQLIAETFLNKQ